MMTRKICSLLALSSIPLSAGQAGDFSNTTAEEPFFGVPNIEFFSRESHSTNLPSYPAGTLSYTYDFETDFDESPGDISSQELSFWAPIAGFNMGDHHIIAAFGYNATKFDTSEETPLTEDWLHDFYLPVGYVYELSDKWIIGGMAMPGYTGDLNSSDNFGFYAAAGAGYSFCPEFQLAAGVFYSTGYGEDDLIPGIQFMWNPNEQWELYLLGPILGASYSVSETTIVGLTAQVSSPTWNVEADSTGPDRDIEVSEIRVGLKVEHQLSEYFWATASAGYLFAREIDIEDEKDREILKEDIDSGAYARFGINLRF